jgi:threonine dehydrogenase-like Zn-dependent dehydrogenase
MVAFGVTNVPSLLSKQDLSVTNFEVGDSSHSPSEVIMVDNDSNRLEVARKFRVTQVIHNDLGNGGHNKLWTQNNTVSTHMFDAVKPPMLLKTMVSGKLQAKQLITHHFTLDEVTQAYDTFEGVMKTEALKVIITNGIMSGKVKSASAAAGLTILEEQAFQEEIIFNDSPEG